MRRHQLRPANSWAGLFGIPSTRKRLRGKSDQLPRCFWRVETTGKSGQDDEQLGESLALEYLAFEEAREGNRSPTILPWIIADMPRRLTAVETGFLAIVANSAGAGANEGRRLAAYYESKRAEGVLW